MAQNTARKGGFGPVDRGEVHLRARARAEMGAEAMVIVREMGEDGRFLGRVSADVVEK